jgi:hypothetical protein
MRSAVLWDMTPFILVEVYRYFHRNVYPSIQILRTVNLYVGCFTLVSCLAYSSILKMESTFSSETSLISNGMHGIISQKLKLFRNLYISINIYHIEVTLPGIIQSVKWLLMGWKTRNRGSSGARGFLFIITFIPAPGPTCLSVKLLLRTLSSEDKTIEA